MGMKFFGVFQVFIINFSCSTWISNKSSKFCPKAFRLLMKYEGKWSSNISIYLEMQIFPRKRIHIHQQRYLVKLQLVCVTSALKNVVVGGACFTTVCKIYLLSFDKHAIDFWWWFTFTQKQTFHAAVTDVALLLFKGAGQGCKGLGVPHSYWIFVKMVDIILRCPSVPLKKAFRFIQRHGRSLKGTDVWNKTVFCQFLGDWFSPQ